MENLSPDYTSFLLRLWREAPPTAPDLAGQEWLAQVRHIPSGEERYFASLDALFAFINAQLPPPRAERSNPNS